MPSADPGFHVPLEQPRPEGPDRAEGWIYSIVTLSSLAAITVLESGKASGRARRSGRSTTR